MALFKIIVWAIIFLTKLILGLPRTNSSTEALQTLHWAKLYQRREMHRRAAVFKYINGLMEVEFNTKRNSAIHSYSTRGSEEQSPFAKS